MKTIANVIIVMAIGLWQLTASAEVIGHFGDEYPIKEQDFLEFIMQRLKTMEKNGELAQFNKTLTERVQEGVNRPTPVEGITRAVENKTWFFDPSITAAQDFADHQGRVFIQKGTVLNPLSQVSLSRALVFFDGDDEAQVAWAKKMDTVREGKIQLILVKGAIGPLNQHFNKAIYFDQEGRLTTRFQITHTPALVTQEGLRLKIEEFTL